MSEFYLTRIEEMLALSPAPNGFYIASGTIEMVPALEQLLVYHRKSLGPIYWIDSGNYFNAYQMAEIAKRQGLDPRAMLQSIKIARPFTAYQFQQMLDKVPTKMPAPLVIISDLLALFFDPELQDADMKRAFREFLTKLMRLKRRAVVLSLLMHHQTPPERKHLLPRVAALADHLHETIRLVA